jgi:AcrR family transcriptional regulator
MRRPPPQRMIRRAKRSLPNMAQTGESNLSTSCVDGAGVLHALAEHVDGIRRGYAYEVDELGKRVRRHPDGLGITARSPGVSMDTRTLILDAARSRLLTDGYAGLSTRKVAEKAGVPLSQLHYHFGSKQGLVRALFEEENQRRLARQQSMYAQDLPLWQRYEQACDYLEDDLDSGYVRVLQESIAAGWSNREVRDAVRELLGGWFALLAEVARETERRHGPLGPFTAEEVATLVGTAFIGSEALLLLGFDREMLPVRSGLRRVGVLIRQLEEPQPGRVGDASVSAAQ